MNNLFQRNIFPGIWLGVIAPYASTYTRETVLIGGWEEKEKKI